MNSIPLKTFNMLFLLQYFQFCPFISSLSVNVSVLTLVMISVDRYKGKSSSYSRFVFTRS